MILSKQNLLSPILFLCGLFSVLTLKAQNTSTPVDTVTWSAVLEQAFEAKSEVVVENKVIVIDNPKLRYKKGIIRHYSDRYPDLVDSLGRINVASPLVIDNCKFDQNIYIHQINFTKRLVISKCEMINLRISESDFGRIRLFRNRVTKEMKLDGVKASAVDLSFNKLNRLISIDNSVIYDVLKIKKNVVRKGDIQVLNSKIDSGSVIMGENIALAENITNCDISLSPGSEFNHFELAGSKPGDFNVKNSVFRGDSSTRLVFNKASYLNLNIENNIFQCNVYFIENKATERFFLVNNTFENYVSFDKFLFSEIWNELYWQQLAGFKLRYKDYGAVAPEDYANEREFNNLINIYKGMHTIFLSRGDLRSANACYSEMKELQGKMHKHIYQNDPTFGNFLRWQLNVLLKLYTNHGTDPGLAVVMSFYVIVSFSLLYVFFPSEWDIGRRTDMYQQWNTVRALRGKSFMISVLSFGTSLFIIVINAITLSINSFVTLGFGSIPTNGFARYLCIIEGFIGWFLLSIFSVALINQVLA
ncbi:MAG: hypothetical protein ABJF11_14270 [Reichenbachiella sp.]|uniref:hypothetical protein n=1 Tax=Reichenbachiella sp. TaxID=2184521 RepID=UPI003266635E